MTDHGETQAFIDKFFPAVERGDMATLRSLYNDDATIWHSRDEVNETVEQNMELIGAFIQRVSNRKYEQVRRYFFDGGFAQTHVTTGDLADGGRIALPVALFCKLRDGKVERLEEYFDSSKSPLRGFAHTKR